MAIDSNPSNSSNVARENKVCADTFTLQFTSKSKLGRQRPINIAKWNVRTLLDNSKRPKRKTALGAKELVKYNIDIAALSKTRFANYGSLIDLGYTFYWSGRKMKTVCHAVTAASSMEIWECRNFGK